MIYNKREERDIKTEIQWWNVYSVEITESLSDGQNDRDIERDLDGDSDKCPT